MYKSNVCRISQGNLDALERVMNLKPGVNPIANKHLPPRQVRLTAASCGPIAATLRFHRGSLIPTIARDVAEELVRDRVAEWCPQSLLVYTMQEYLDDADVQADTEEFERAKNAERGLVAVAVIGDNRSALAVCRNIVSGCQVPERLLTDATGAMEASNIFLVEED